MIRERICVIYSAVYLYLHNKYYQHLFQREYLKKYEIDGHELCLHPDFI